MRTYKIRVWIAAIGLALVLVGCGEATYVQPETDVTDPVVPAYVPAASGKYNDSAAYVISMPEYYSNVAIRCVGGNGVYEAQVGAGINSGIAQPAIVVNDPLCKEGGFIDQLHLTKNPDKEVK